LGKLKHPKRVILSKSDAYAIIVFVWGKSKIKSSEFTKEDCGFAQALLVEMLDGSFSIGFVEKLFSASNPPGGVIKVIKAFLKGAGKNFVKYKDKDDLKKMIKEPIIANAPKVQVARINKSNWALRENGCEISY